MKLEIPFYPLREYLESHRDWVQGAAIAAVDSGYLIGGEAVEKFEFQFAKFTGSSYAVGVANGLDAIRLTLQSLGIGPGDEVIVPSFTFIATWLAVTQVGAKPIPVDVNIETASMNIVDLPITKRTKAVIFVHLYGYPTDLTSLAENLKKSGIYLIEDCAQAHGAKIGDKHVGTFGDAGCFSFYPTKNLGAIGDAGGIITNSYEVSRKLKSLRSYGVGSSKYNHVDLGMNSRLDPIQASFLISRLANLAEENKSRIRIANEITNSLKSSRIIKPLDRKTTGVDVFHLLVVTYEGDRENFQKKLLDKGVQTDVHYPKAIHQQECYLTPEYSYLKSSNFPVSEYLAASVLSLPIFPWMDQARLSYLTRTLEELNSEKL